MIAAPLPSDEARRLQSLQALEVLDTPDEAEFTALARAASLVCGTPIALLSLVDANRQWFKANIGLTGVSETPRDLAFCAHALHEQQVLEVPDALQDLRFADNPLVTDTPNIRFYAGAPVRLSDGAVVGTLCVIDRQPRHLTDTQREVLEQLAVAASRALETRHTERQYRAQQQQLVQNEQRQRQMYEATPSMHYSLDLQGRFLSVSDMLAQRLGFSRQEMMTKTPADFMTPQSRRRAIDEAFPEFLRTGVSNRVAYRWVCKSGEVMDVLVSAILVRDATGKPLHSLSTVEDVSQYLRAERELQDERTRLANIINGTGAGTWEHNFVTGINRVNDRYCQMLGYSAEEMQRLINGYFYTLLHPDDQEVTLERWNAHMQDKVSEYVAEFRMRHRDGHWVWIQSRGRKGAVGADGRVSTISGIHLDVSARRNAIEAANRAVHDLQKTLDALPSMVVYVDPDLRYRFANRAYGDRYGVDAKTLAGKHISEILPPSLYQLNLPLMRQALAGHEQEFERDVMTAAGPRHSVVRYLPDTVDGKVRGIYMFLLDITELKLTQDALVAERERLESIVKGTHAGTWQLNVLDGELRINRRWAEIAGCTVEELLPFSSDALLAMVHPEDVQRVRQTMMDHVTGQLEYYECEYRIRHRQGHWIWVQDRGRISSRNAEGRVQWVSGTHLDVNARVLAEQRLNEQFKFVEVLLEATPTAIYIKDAQGRYLRFNPAFERLFGVQRGDWVGKNVLELVPGDAGLMMHAKDLELFATGQPQTYEAQFTHRITGEKREGLYYKAALTNEQGVITGLVGTILDVTERNQVARDLAHAKSVAEAATEAKSRFLANMSHELRTPMNAVLGMLKLLQSTELTRRQLDYTNKTESAARSLLGLLNDILDFSKMEAGKMQLDPHPFRIDRLMRDLAVVLSSTVGNKPVEVLYDIAPDLPDVVLGDAMRLRQVLINLGGNAVKFTERGQVVVAVRPVASDAAGRPPRIEFAVIDSGIGIAPEAQAHIFSGFSQAEASTTRRFGGTGLGLAISQRLVELMGGVIHIDSAPGRGSTFFFQVELPVPEQIPDDLRKERSTQTHARRVLVVDDNELSRTLIAQATQSWGWPTDVVASGEQALQRIERRSIEQAEPYEVIYVDWQMPGLDGWQTTSRIRALTQQLGLPRPLVVMVTANGRESLAQRTVEEQAMLDGFLVKPVTASMLLDAVASAAPDKVGLRHGRRASKRQLEGLRLLVVEDNLINQQVAEELLISEGALVSLAADGRQGVNAVLQASEPYHAVLMDIQMPVLDGYAATREIRRTHSAQVLPIIGLTANAMASDRALCLQAGMNEHMGKPFDLAQLVSMLIRLTQHRPALAPEVSEPAQGASTDGLTRAINATNAGPTDGPAEGGAPVSAAQRPLSDEPPDLDLETALRRMSGMTSLYGRAAQEFLKTLPTVQDELSQAITQQQLDQAKAVLHTYKGTAGTLGLMRLSRLCAVLEVQAKAGEGAALKRDLQAHWPAVAEAATKALHAAVQNLRMSMEPPQTVDPRNGTGNGTGLDAVALCPADRALVQQLQQLLAMSDLDALQVFAKARSTAQTLPGPWLAQLDTALAQLDLATALSLCEQLLASTSASA